MKHKHNQLDEEFLEDYYDLLGDIDLDKLLELPKVEQIKKPKVWIKKEVESE